MKTLFNQTTSPSMEAIQVQQPKAFKALTDLFKRYLESDKAGYEALDREVEETIHGFTNLQKVTFSRGLGGPMISIPNFHADAKLVQAELQKLSRTGSAESKIKNLCEVARGWVDVKNGKVGGIFSLIPLTIYFPKNIIQGSLFTPEEKAAILLHEVGHAITWYLYVARSVTTNAITAVAAADIFNDNAPAKREVVFAAIKEGLNLKSVSFKELEQTNSPSALTVFLLDASRKELRSELGSDVYDMVAWEALADQYAVRMGAGAELASALSKMLPGKVSWYFMAASEIVFIISSGFLVTTGQLGLVILGVMGLLGTWLGGTGIGDYDRSEARLRRIRNDMQAELRTKDVEESVRRTLQDRLDWVDRSIDQVKDNPKLIEIIRRYFVQSERQRGDFEELQQDLESLAANRLYEHAALLRNLY